jgi:hypothetical protein
MRAAVLIGSVGSKSSRFGRCPGGSTTRKRAQRRCRTRASGTFVSTGIRPPSRSGSRCTGRRGFARACCRTPICRRPSICGELGKEVAIEAQRFGITVVAADCYANATLVGVPHESNGFGIRWAIC